MFVGVGVLVTPDVNGGVGPVGVALGVLVKLEDEVGEGVIDLAGVLVRVTPDAAVLVGSDVLSGVVVSVEVDVLVAAISVVD